MKYFGLLLVIVAGGLIWLLLSAGGGWQWAYPSRLTTFGPAAGPAIPVNNMLQFFRRHSRFERVADIARDPADIAYPVTRSANGTVKIELEAKEVLAEMAPGITFNYWTFNGTVPGPFLRVKEGDTVEITLSNHPTSLQHHNIDLHAVTGPGGGAALTNVAPGESAGFVFKALNPGLYVYHCAHPNAAAHVAHGMHGLILVEPKGGLPPVDKEFYVMQGEFYSAGRLGRRGLQMFSAQKMLDGQPSYVVFNGRVNGLGEKIQLNTGQRARVFFGNGGVNLVSSFHIIGEIFDRVYPEAAIGAEPHRNVQSTIVPAGGATITDLTTDIPGKYALVDHALARMDRGAWGLMQVTGPDNPSVFRPVSAPDQSNSDHSH